jgi:hypothetical protein
VDESQDQTPTDRFLSAFWQDLADELDTNPAFRRAFAVESERIAEIDAAVNKAKEAGDRTDFYSMRPEEIADWVSRGDPAGRDPLR